MEARRCPEEVLGWIPWYPDQGLSDAQRGAVEAHASACEACRREIALVLGEAEPADVPAADAVFARVRARIDASEPVAPTRIPGAAAPRGSRRARPPRAVALAAMLVLGAALGLVAESWLRAAREPVYTTAADPAPLADPRVLDVVFRDDVDMARIRGALEAVQGEIVAGPTQLGRFRVRVAPGVDPIAASRALAAESSGVAVFAEPVPR